MSTALPEIKDPAFGRWLDQVAAPWAREWADAVARALPGLAVANPEALRHAAAEGVEALTDACRTGSEALLRERAGDLARLALARGWRVAELARALDLGRSALLARVPFSKLGCKAAAKAALERSFGQALYFLLEAYQAETERHAADARRSLEVSEAGAARFREEWDLLDQILSGMDVGIVLLDRDLNVIWMNRTMPRALLTEEPARAVGRRCFDVLRADSEECRACAAQAVFQGRPSVQHLKHTDGPGAARDYLKITRPIGLSAPGEPHVMQIYLDITSQQEVQRSLARTQELVRNILDSSVNGIIATDVRGRVTLFNKTAARLFAYAESEVVGLAVADRYVGGRDEAARVLRMLREHGSVRDHETAFFDKNGRAVHVRLTASLLKDERGHVLGTLGFVQDLSVEEALRQEMAARDRYLLSLLHGSVDGLITVDASGKVASWNRGAALIFGVPPDRALGRPIDQFLPPEDVRRLPAAPDAPARIERFEFRKAADGAEMDLLVTRTEIGGGPERGISYVLKDVTELKRLQRELSEAEHLAELGRLAASVAHEIKNPIAGLRGAMEVMGGVHVESDPRFAVFREALSQIRRLDALVKDRLAYAKPVTIRTEPVPVHLLVEAALGLVKEPLAASGVVLENKVPEDLPPVMADPLQVQQVLVNLIMNAIQATPAGGTVTVEARAAGSGADIAVRDTGCGIPPEVLASIYKPFFTTKHVGTGLGLSIVQRLLRAHGGSCSVQSEQGRGTTFTVHLPGEGGEG